MKDSFLMYLSFEELLMRLTPDELRRMIPEEILPTLFDGNTKHNSSPTGDGKRNMGLGLSVCKAIVRAHGGTMSAHNLPEGAEFTFQLPLN